MTRPVRYLIIAGICSFVTIGALLVAYPREGSNRRINKASFERLEWGMNEHAVENLFGVPAGDYQSDYAKTQLSAIGEQYYFLPNAKVWQSDDYGPYEAVWIVFDEKGNLGNCGYRSIGLTRSFLDTLDTLRNMLRL